MSEMGGTGKMALSDRTARFDCVYYMTDHVAEELQDIRTTQQSRCIGEGKGGTRCR